jgi:hypothetical protein
MTKLPPMSSIRIVITIERHYSNVTIRRKTMSKKKDIQYDIHIEYPHIDGENSLNCPVNGGKERAEELKKWLDETFPDNIHEIRERHD